MEGVKGARKLWSRDEVHAAQGTKRGNSNEEVWELGRLGTRTKEEQCWKCIQWLRGRGAGLDQGRRPASRARCSWSPCGAAER